MIIKWIFVCFDTKWTYSVFKVSKKSLNELAILESSGIISPFSANYIFENVGTLSYKNGYKNGLIVFQNSLL